MPSGLQNFKMDKSFYSIDFLSVQVLWSHSLLPEAITGQVLILWSVTQLGPGLVGLDSADETSTQYLHYGGCHSSLHACKNLGVSTFSSVFFLPVLKLSFLLWIPLEGHQELWLNETWVSPWQVCSVDGSSDLHCSVQQAENPLSLLLAKEFNSYCRSTAGLFDLVNFPSFFHVIQYHREMPCYYKLAEGCKAKSENVSVCGFFGFTRF